MARKRRILFKLGTVKVAYRPKDNNIEKLKLFIKEKNNGSCK